MTTAYGADDPADYLKTREELDADNERGEEERLKQEAVILAYKRLFATEDGKKVLEHMSLVCHELSDCFFHGEYKDFVLGKRSVILEIRRIIDKDINDGE